MADYPEEVLELLRKGLLAIDDETGQVVTCKPEKRRLFEALYSPRRAGKRTAAEGLNDLHSFETSGGSYPRQPRDWWTTDLRDSESSRTGQRTDGWSEEDLTLETRRARHRIRSERPASPERPTSLIERPPVMVSEVLPLECNPE